MRKVWQLQEAKAQLSQLVKEAISSGPQLITLHGKPCVVLLSKEEFNKLANPQESFVKFMRKSPLVGVKLDIKRSKDKTRDIDL